MVQVCLTKKALTMFFISPQLDHAISKKSISFQGSRGGPTISRGGGPTFSRGDSMAYSL